jgi:cytochrome c peroxidase
MNRLRRPLALASLALTGLMLAFSGLAAPDVAEPAHPRRAAWQALYRVPAQIPFPEDAPYDARVAAIGERLFHDPNLSRDRNRSCASCHDTTLAWADGRPRPIRLDGGELDMRTPSLIGLAMSDGTLGWDGKFKDLEAVAFGPITAASNMGLTEAEALARIAADPAYGTMTRPQVERAIAMFERAIPLRETPFDRWIAGDEHAIPERAKRGFDLFNGRANCAACHSGPTFTDGSFHDIGYARDDEPGRARLMSRSIKARHAFKTPGLREASGRGAYMHDGRIRDLAAVIALYSQGGTARDSLSSEIHRLDLDARERADLVAFLATLSAGPEARPIQAPPASSSARPDSAPTTH